MNLGNVWSNDAKWLRNHAIGDGMQPGWQRKAFDAKLHFLPKARKRPTEAIRGLWKKAI